MNTYTRFMRAMRDLIDAPRLDGYLSGLPACYRSAFQDIIDLVLIGDVKAANSIMMFLIEQRDPHGNKLLAVDLPFLVPDGLWQDHVPRLAVAVCDPERVTSAVTASGMVNVNRPYTLNGGSVIVEIDCPDGDELLRRLPELEPFVMAGWKLFMVTHI